MLSASQAVRSPFLPSSGRFRELLFIAGISAGMFLATNSAFGQAAGPGAGNVQNEPGYTPRPAGKPESIPKQPDSPQVKAVLAQISAAGLRHPQTPEQTRKAYAFYSRFSGPPENVFQVDNRQIPGPAGAIPIRVYTPRAGDGFPVWVFFHGGGFIAGSLDSYDATLRAITNRCECVVVSVGYRLAPESKFPAATDDAYAATKWVAEHAADVHGDANRIEVGGDGAGGNLAAVAAIMSRDRSSPRLAKMVLINPILNASVTSFSWVTSQDPILSSEDMVKNLSVYVPINADLKSPTISPVNAKDLKGLPPTLILTSADDPVRDDINNFADNLSMAGVPEHVSVYPDAIHEFFLMSGALDSSKKAIDETAAALKTTGNPAK